ncbi:hypothetical protein H9638_14835, partial [Arthrobacter sp. Sa2BUA2]|nr:hypothetical protein [Arthrobacter pullicola]
MAAVRTPMRTTASAAGAAGSHGAHVAQGAQGSQGSHGTHGTLDAPQASSPAGAEDTADPAGTARLYEWLAALADAELPHSDTALIDHIRALEELKSACAAVQARAAAAFDASQRQAQARAGIPPAQLGRGIGAQIALARRDSPHR